ncbi:RHS repeat-associated core domain-containing protein [Bdellovibrio sp. HCB117]|uniref:RHS repeat-associated core domain-containing protein n=1 Tax=Bdellovibrio sp. HCB117 TaxID=3394359 RepID=UPI0039B58040
MRRRNGKPVQGFIYQTQYQITAETDGAGNIIRRFVYGSKINIPDYVVTGGKEYRVISNQVGTPKAIVESSTGKIVETLSYDEFGVSLDGKRSSYLPFGFAGGLSDSDTSLLRFGARDYDPIVGRWTSKDPIGFNGGDTNFYGYTFQDPVNFVDPSGLRPPGQSMMCLDGNCGGTLRDQFLSEIQITPEQVGAQDSVILNAAVGTAAAAGAAAMTPAVSVIAINICLSNPAQCTRLGVSFLSGLASGLTGERTGNPPKNYSDWAAGFSGRSIGSGAKKVICD